MGKVIFRSTDLFGTKVWDEQGEILVFKPQGNNIIKNQAGEKMKTNESDDWVCILDSKEDAELIERAKKHPKFKQEYWIVDKIPPRRNAVQNAPKTDVTKYVRLGELKSKIVKTDGSYVKNTDETLIAEYESLQNELFPNGE